MQTESEAQRHGDNRSKSMVVFGDRAQAIHQALPQALLGGVITVAHTHMTGMPPDLSCHEEEAQPASG